MGQTVKQPHSNFVFTLHGNPRLGQVEAWESRNCLVERQDWLE